VTDTPTSTLTASVLMLSAVVLAAPLQCFAWAEQFTPTGVRPHTHMTYLIRETLRNGTKVQAVDVYYIHDVSSDGSIDIEARWGVVGYETPSIRIRIFPLDPSDPRLNTVSAIIDVHVPDGVYKFGRSVTTVEHGGFIHNGNSFSAIVMNETIRDHRYPFVLIYRGVHYYDAMTGILLHSEYAYGPPTFSKGTIDLMATNAFSEVLPRHDLHSIQLWEFVALVLLAALLILTASSSLLYALGKGLRAACLRAVQGWHDGLVLPSMWH